jgi:hypothetical protein
MRLDLTVYSVTFAPWRVGVVGPPRRARRAVVDVERSQRTKDERLEVVAKRLAGGSRSIFDREEMIYL